MRPLEVLLCFVLIGTSAFVSASEVALFSLSKFQLRALKERFASAHRRIRLLISDPAGLLTSLLLTNELVNIFLSVLIAEAISRSWPRPAIGFEGSGISRLFHMVNLQYFPAIPEWLMQILCGVLVTTPIIVLFCDVTPKVISARANHIVAPLVAAPLTLLYRAFKPIRFILNTIVTTMVRLLVRNAGQKGAEGKQGPLLREEEFMIMMEEGLKEGAINQNEMELIRNVLDLDDTRVSEVSTPISQTKVLPENMKVSAALLELKTLNFSRIPVVKPGTRLVTGVLYSKDLLLTRLLSSEGEHDERLKHPISSLMRKPMLIPDSTPLNQVFRKMKRNQTHLAIVSNERDQTTGIVTMNDVLSALFEDILQ